METSADTYNCACVCEGGRERGNERVRERGSSESVTKK